MTAPPFSLPPGWGAELWGAGGWGGPEGLVSFELQVAPYTAIALAENLVQIQFTVPVYFSSLLDVGDASDPSHFVITPVAGTTGMDGNAVRPVTVASVAQSTTDIPAGVAFGASLDLTLDRPMTPWPAQYSLVVSGVVAASDRAPIDPGHSSATFPAIFKRIIPPSIDLPAPTRDIANPSSLFGAQGLPNPQNPALLGVFQVDDHHDYAIDSGLQSFKKRMYRRFVTKPGSFLHLGQSYGIGIPQEGKKLATASVQQRLSSQVETQLGQEPEVAACKCSTTNDVPGLVRFNVRVKLKSGKAFAYSVPFSSV